MKLALIACGGVVLLTASASGAAEGSRFVKNFAIPDSTEVIVVADGDLEAAKHGTLHLGFTAACQARRPTSRMSTGCRSAADQSGSGA
jgi:hypothetical protein